jgi:hypothetical protein
MNWDLFGPEGPYILARRHEGNNSAQETNCLFNIKNIEVVELLHRLQNNSDYAFVSRFNFCASFSFLCHRLMKAATANVHNFLVHCFASFLYFSSFN